MVDVALRQAARAGEVIELVAEEPIASVKAGDHGEDRGSDGDLGAKEAVGLPFSVTETFGVL